MFSTQLENLLMENHEFVEDPYILEFVEMYRKRERSLER